MPTVHLIHGAFVPSDSRGGSLRHLKDFFGSWDRRFHVYGWRGPVSVALTNWATAREIVDQVADGDIMVAHSNGCLLAWMVCNLMAKKGRAPTAVVCIAPAMRQDTEWPEGDYRVLCIHNPADWVVELGRVFGRLWEHCLPIPHGWGSAGRLGFTRPDTRVSNWNVREYDLEVHSDVLNEHVSEWGPRIEQWCHVQIVRDRG